MVQIGKVTLLTAPTAKKILTKVRKRKRAKVEAKVLKSAVAKKQMVIFLRIVRAQGSL